MLRSLVGSEMCIRDSGANMDSAQTGVTLHEMRRADGTQDIHLAADPNQAVLLGHAKHCPALHHNPDPTWVRRHEFMSCLLYTSDAADEEDSGDLGGRRINKKKNREVE
eukprot:TRINITY_DN10600_c0_g1_i3.p1 TRINITY_DN10600_c0_g1~~TRINITY_DN10600_c0_g1_i3.p1  ORF type:complete len:109 (+),score=36.69 TRINITY_DN10600_c0_g1_i3:134-460(+)